MALGEPGPPQREQDGRLPLSTEVDRLADGPDVRRWPLVALVALLVVAVVGAWAEGRRRAPAEREALAACAERGEAVGSRAETRVAATVSYVSPSLARAGPELHDALVAIVSREAGKVVGDVEEALADCRDVGLWPFNRAHDEIRDAYVAYLVAQRDRLREIVRDGDTFDRGYDEVRELRVEAGSLLAE